ncbi:MAG: Nif3-like dinuclear metal center hexameric protein, partial [Candidatus Woesebacteria bacterium]
QILGGERVEKVALGVSLNSEFLEKAADWGSNFCIFHHGFDPRTHKSRFPSFSQKRLKIIFVNNMTIAGFHFALDAHPAIGNNAIIIKKLGAKLDKPFFDDWGYTASFSKKRDVHDLAHKCKDLFDHEIFAVANGPKKVKKIAVVSGAGRPTAAHIAEMESRGVELYISGETSESIPHKMKEAKINYFLCGHYATEVFGIKALGERIESEFKEKIKVKFIDVENPI